MCLLCLTAVLPLLLSGTALGTWLHLSASLSPSPGTGTNLALVSPTNRVTPLGEVSRLEVAHAAMVTVELDFGPKTPSVSEALRGIERRSEPDQGKGRTFAVLDAYGNSTREGKLRLSMHVSAEQSGSASLLFKRTGEVLWRARIVKGTNSPAANFLNRGLVILFNNGDGHTLTVDGSNHPRSILEAKVKELGVPVAEIWPEGAERELSFLYSACGCPVKITAARAGDRTVRTSDLPVIFPDDPVVAATIKRIMQWE